MLGEYQYKTIDGTRKLLPVREYIYLDGIQAAMNVWDNADPVHPQKQMIYFATNQTGQPMVVWDNRRSRRAAVAILFSLGPQNAFVLCNA